VKVDIFNTDKKYQIIYADPPWSYKCWSKKGEGRSAESHYHTMPTSEIAKFPINKIAEKDCVLFMWVTFPTLTEFKELLTAWEFTYKTVAFAWIKLNKRTPIGSFQIVEVEQLLQKICFCGMGRWTRANAEICLLATRGNPKRINASVGQLIFSPIKRHSEKPSEAREKIIKLVGDLPRIELFARQQIAGWDCWGNEV
jgi:N6-adenosine-specific RNA methylase IME4